MDNSAKRERPKIPVIPEEHSEEFDYAVYRAKKGKGFGKWFIGLIIIGVLVWMIPGSFDSEESIVANEPAGAKVPLEKRDINLYLADNSEGGLVSTAMTLDLGGTIEEKIYSVLEALFNENQMMPRLFPQEMIVRDVFMNGDEAIVSLDGAFKKKFMGGGWSELLAVYSIVNTVSNNFAEANTVRILIDDRETGFFVSHVSVAGSLSPNTSLLVLEETPLDE